MKGGKFLDFFSLQEGFCSMELVILLTTKATTKQLVESLEDRFRFLVRVGVSFSP
jgi:hypothetical protein